MPAGTVSAPGPLAGVRVLEATHVLAGSYCGALLADLGADVVKLERPGGDESRGPDPGADGFGPANRNKRSIVIDLRHGEGPGLVREVIGSFDVFVENFRPGVMTGLGLGYGDLSAVNPALVYCSISGFGATGPYRDRGGFDLVAQGMSGVMSVTGEPGGRPVKAGVPIGDLTAGTFAALGITAAYVHRMVSGHGQYVDTSLLEGALAFTVWESAEYFATGVSPEPVGSAHRLTAPYEAYATSDGWINIGAANESTWRALATAIGRPDLLVDARFANVLDRRLRREELAEELAPIFASGTTAAWCSTLQEAGVPCGPVNQLEEVWSDPHILARQMLVEAPTVAGPRRFIGSPIKLSRTPTAVRRGVPAPGADTVAVLRESGVPAGRIEDLEARHVIGQSTGERGRR